MAQGIVEARVCLHRLLQARGSTVAFSGLGSNGRGSHLHGLLAQPSVFVHGRGHLIRSEVGGIEASKRMAILRFDDEIVGKRHGFAVEAQTTKINSRSQVEYVPKEKK